MEKKKEYKNNYDPLHGIYISSLDGKEHKYTKRPSCETVFIEKIGI